MKKAIITHSFSVVQWHDNEYPYYEDDASANEFAVGDEVLVLKEATPNPMARLFVVYSEKTNQATVVTESYLKFKE